MRHAGAMSSSGFPALRARRLRRGRAIREMVQEVRLHPSDFIAPLFVQEGTTAPTAVGSMPGVFRLNLDDLVREYPNNCLKTGIGA